MLLNAACSFRYRVLVQLYHALYHARARVRACVSVNCVCDSVST